MIIKNIQKGYKLLLEDLKIKNTYIPVVSQKNYITLNGVGLHAGIECFVKIRISPHPGIYFHRVDIAGSQPFKLSLDVVTDTSFSTLISSGISSINTIEHLLSVLHILHISNIIIEVYGPEIPILDGSSLNLYSRLLKFKNDNINFINNSQTLFVKKIEKIDLSDDCYAIIEPSSHLIIDYTIDFPNKIIGKQKYIFDSKLSNYHNEIAYARTFVLKEQINFLIKQQKALGGSLDNAIVVDDYKVLNPSGLRDPLEFVKHKILDLIGDLYVNNTIIIGKFTVFKGGHSLHKKILENIIL